MLNSQGTLKRRLLVLAVLALCVAGAAAIGFFKPFEEISKKLSVYPVRSPSGTMAFVGLGTIAEETYGPLPWRYSDYARLLTSLEPHRPKAVMFDLRMDYNQAPAEILAFEQALQRAKFPVILRAVETGNIWWADTEPQPPLPQFARHSIVVGEQYDDQVMFGARSAPTCVKYGSSIYPHAAVVLAGKKMLPCRNFALDLGLDRDKVPYFGGMDILSGKVQPSSINGKILVVGSAHFEESGLLSGAGRTEEGLLAIIAAETLLVGAPPDLSWHVPLALAFLFCLLLVYRLPRIRWYAFIGISVLVFVLVPALLLVLRVEAEVVPALALLLLTCARVNNARAQLDAKREGEVTDPRSGLPNLESLREQPVFGSLLVAMSSVDPGADRTLPVDLKLVGASQEYDAGFGRRLWRVESIGTSELFSTLLSMKDAAEISGTSFGFSVDVDVASPPFKRAVAALERAQEAASEGVVVRSTADEPRRLLGPPGKVGGIYALPLVRPDDGSAAGVRLAAAGRANDDCGAIGDLGQLRDVLREAITICGEAAPLPDDFRILVPVDMEILKRPQSIEAVREAIRISELRFDQFAFEISLPAFHASGPRGLAALQGFRKLGLEIVVSDFSGPEPGLEALRAIPATAMLVHCLGDCASPFERDALRTGMRLALELGRDVIASGTSQESLPGELDEQSILLLGTPTSVADLGFILGPDRRRRA